MLELIKRCPEMDKIPSYNDAEGHHIMRRYWIYL